MTTRSGSRRIGRPTAIGTVVAVSVVVVTMIGPMSVAAAADGEPPISALPVPVPSVPAPPVSVPSVSVPPSSDPVPVPLIPVPPVSAPMITQASGFEPGGSTADLPTDPVPAGPVIDNGPIVTDASSFEPQGPPTAAAPAPMGPVIAPSGVATSADGGPTRLAYTGGADAVLALVGLGLIGLGSATCRFGAKRGAAS